MNNFRLTQSYLEAEINRGSYLLVAYNLCQMFIRFVIPLNVNHFVYYLVSVFALTKRTLFRTIEQHLYEKGPIIMHCNRRFRGS